MKDVLKFLKHPAFIAIAITALGIAGLVYLVKAIPTNNDEYAQSTTDHVRWNPNSNVVMTEYGDFQCPACGNFYQTTEKSLEEKYKDKVKLVFRHMPLTSLHRNAQKAAEASEAANAQGKFWEYHDILYSRQTADAENWDTDKFVSYAKELNLDTEKFKKELTSNYWRKVVKDQSNEASSKGYNSTPTIEINGKKIENATLETLSKEIDKALEAAGANTTTVTPTVVPTSTPTGTPAVTAEPTKQ